MDAAQREDQTLPFFILECRPHFGAKKITHQD